MNYTELKKAIQDYCENSETSFVENIPTFVREAERRIYRSVMLPELRANATATMGAGSQYVAKPTDFLSVFSLAVIDSTGTYSYLIDKDVNFIREAYPSPATQGVPKYYGVFDGDQSGGSGNFILGPTADEDYTVELHYFYDPESIVTAGTSWLGENASPPLLYGSLIEAYTYVKGEPDILKLYQDRYSEALGQLSGVSVRNTRDEYRDGKMG